ncbi:hypothetical protein ACRALDRAFT_1080818 [Sodiomyces alcalophilus JCM 7366]|uniref:uncharacterized protein n=1 Tax=Sodiomyces alcalophilus JCM 7366 TaxID=591952 RepID=UPI0039B62313
MEAFNTGMFELDDVIAQTPEPLVRAILLALCDDTRVRTRAFQYLARLEQHEAEARRPSVAVSAAGGEEGSRSPTSASYAHGNTNPMKRKKTGAPRICAQCDMIFTDEENEFGACRYHSGILELADETKIEIDWDAVSVEELDTESHREAFPAAFRWICCRVAADQAGCRRGRHEANPDRSRKGRGSDTDSRVSSLDEDPLQLDAEDDDIEGGDASGPTTEEMRMDRIRRLIGSGGGEDEDEDGNGDAHGTRKEGRGMHGGRFLGGSYRWVPLREAGGGSATDGREPLRRGQSAEVGGDGGAEGHGGLRDSAAVVRPRSDSHPMTAAHALRGIR